MDKILVYGIVLNNTFYSGNMKILVSGDNGIYYIDVADTNYLKTLTPANMEDFKNYIKKTQKMSLINGYLYEDGFIPENSIKYDNIPIQIKEFPSDEWAYIKVLYLVKHNVYYFIEHIFNSTAMKLMELNELISEDADISNMKGITPEMRILFAMHKIKIVQERLYKEKEQKVKYKNSIKGFLEGIFKSVGGKLIKVIKQAAKRLEVIWELHGRTISTVVEEDYSVKEAGFCISGDDRKHTISSLPNLLDSYHKDGEGINITRRLK